MSTVDGQASPLLVVEDNDADYEIINLLLAEAGFLSPIVHCRTGEEAIEYMAGLQKKPGGGNRLPAHILLDLNLPGMSGLDVLVELRGSDVLKLIPVTILTTSSHPRDIHGCYRAGANSYLIKPVDFGRLEKMIRGFAAYWFDIAVTASRGAAYA